MVYDIDEVVHIIDIRSIEGRHIRYNIFDELFFLVATLNYREFGGLNEFVFDGDVCCERSMIRRKTMVGENMVLIKFEGSTPEEH